MRVVDKAVRTSSTIRVFQLRTDPELLQEIKSRASERHVSANRFVVEAVRAALRAEKEQERAQEWRAGFEAMGRDLDTNNVEYALPAVREVLFGE